MFFSARVKLGVVITRVYKSKEKRKYFFKEKPKSFCYCILNILLCPQKLLVNIYEVVDDFLRNSFRKYCSSYTKKIKQLILYRISALQNTLTEKIFYRRKEREERLINNTATA